MSQLKLTAGNPTLNISLLEARRFREALKRCGFAPGKLGVILAGAQASPSGDGFMTEKELAHEGVTETEPLHLFMYIGTNPAAQNVAAMWRAFRNQGGGLSGLEALYKAGFPGDSQSPAELLGNVITRLLSIPENRHAVDAMIGTVEPPPAIDSDEEE